MGPAAEPSSSEKKPPPSNAQSEYQKFEEKVKRCLMLEDVTPQATIPMVDTALGQFGTVVSIDMIKDPFDSKHAAKRVIVEMKTPREAAHAVKEIQEHPFMIKGVPRPVRALPAVATMFPDRPQKHYSGTKRTCEWVKPGDPEWEKYNEFKQLAKKHAQETAYLMEVIRKEEEKLAQDQEEKVKENLKKLDEIHNCVKDKTIHRLSRYYGVKFEGMGMRKHTLICTLLVMTTSRITDKDFMLTQVQLGDTGLLAWGGGQQSPAPNCTYTEPRKQSS